MPPPPLLLLLLLLLLLTNVVESSSKIFLQIISSPYHRFAVHCYTSVT